MIASHCDRPSLLALARTCIFLHKIAIEALYHTVVIKGSKKMRLFDRRTGAHWRTEHMMSKTQCAEIYMPWKPDHEWAHQYVHVLQHMTSLKYLKIVWDYSERYEREELVMYIPSYLSNTLTYCSVGFACSAEGSFKDVISLFQHQSLKTLDLHHGWSMIEGINDFTSTIIGKHKTALETLNLIDCHFTPPILSWMLTFPKRLRYLTIGSDVDNNVIWDEQLVDHGDYFRAILDSGHSLHGFSFNFTDNGWQVAPAPGLHELGTIRYLETCEEHFERREEDPDSEYPMPDIECPFEQLLPPSIEVLKFSPHAPSMEPVFGLISRKKVNKDYLPHLRRIILTHHYRDVGSAQLLREAALKDKDRRDYCRALEEIRNDWPVDAEKPDIRRLKGFAATVNVEIMQIYYDTARKEVFREGIGRALWDIPEQIAPLSAETMASFKELALAAYSESEDEASESGDASEETA